ncbi:putative ribonuclease H-like domain-containing protein, partial [Tanacetum coccineum]
LADSKLPTTFWAKAVNTACYVQNRALVVKPYNKTPYELFRGMFDGKADEDFFVGYSMSSKGFRLYNIRTRKVEENLHIEFLENKHIVAGDKPKWLFDIDMLTKSMNYVPVIADGSPLFDSSPKISDDVGSPPFGNDGKKDDKGSPSKEYGFDDQERPEHDNSTKNVNTVRPSINTASTNVSTGSSKIDTTSSTVNTRSSGYQTDPDMSTLGDYAILEATNDDFLCVEADMSNITNTYLVPSTPITRIHKDHSLDNVIGAVQSGIEPTRVAKALSDPAWVDAMQEELLQFKL